MRVVRARVRIEVARLRVVKWGFGVSGSDVSGGGIEILGLVGVKEEGCTVQISRSEVGVCPLLS